MMFWLKQKNISNQIICTLVVVGNADEIAPKLKRFSMTGKIDYYDIYGNTYDPSVKEIPEGVTIESVLNNYVDALGGKENIQKIKDKTMKMSGEIQGMKITVTMHQKYPNKLYQIVDVGGGMMTQKLIFDGVKGIQDQMGQTTEITGDQLEQFQR